MLYKKTSLGIEIAADRISFALVAKTTSKTILLKAGHIETPKDCLSNGNIADSAKLAKAIRRLLRKNRITTHQATVSLVANPHLIQIIDLPLDMPSNLGNFIESEIKHSSVLLGRTHKSDYCGLAGKNPDGQKRVIVSAVEEKKLAPLTKALNLAKIEPLSIEPASIGLMRGLYGKFVAENFNYNVLFALLSGSTITMCVFRKGVLDFIRSRELPTSDSIIDNSGYFYSQIKTIKQYYDIEVSSFKDEPWAVVLDVNPEQINTEKVESYLNHQFQKVHLCSTQNPSDHTFITVKPSVKEASICAVGMAQKELSKSAMNIRFDLVPSVEREKRAVKRWSFAAACFAIAIISAFALVHNMMDVRLLQASSVISSVKSSLNINEIPDLITESKHLENQLDKIDKTKASFLEVLDSSKSHDWASVFSMLIKASPRDLCIMDMRQIGENTLVIHGKVTAHASVHKFASNVSASSLFESAIVSQMSLDSNYEGLIDYTIDCVMKAEQNED